MLAPLSPPHLSDEDWFLVAQRLCWLRQTIHQHRRPSLQPSELTLMVKNALTLPYGISLWGNYSFQSRGHQDIAQVEPIHTVSLLIMKKLLQNKLSVALEVSDLFDKERTEYVMNINGISAYNHTKADSRRVSLTISYDFNSKKSRYKGTQSTSEIDRL